MQFNIIQLERALPSGLVTTIHWTASQTTDGTTASTYGAVGLTGDPEDPSFIAYADITKEQAILWLEDTLGAESLANMQTSLDAQIVAIKNPVSASGTPWGNNPNSLGA